MDADRNETDAERYDRNWLELVQELRVAQTGIQILAGFLLTLPFTSRFEDIADHQRVLFLTAFSLAVLTVGLLGAPVAMHRFLFGRHAKDVLVRTADRIAKAALAGIGLTLVVVVVLIFDVVVGTVAGVVAGAVGLVFYVLVWVVLPMTVAGHLTEKTTSHREGTGG